MDRKELAYLASVAIGKGMDFEMFGYSDYMYGKEHLIEDVWEYVQEANEQGRDWFRDEYSDCNLYWGF